VIVIDSIEFNTSVKLKDNNIYRPPITDHAYSMMALKL